jgi:sulfate adenylyltransferase
VNERICPHNGDDIVPPSGTRIREMLIQGKVPPKEMMRPEVAEIILNFDNPFVE